MLGQFGCDKPSIGFSIMVDSLMAAIARQGLHIPVDVTGVLLLYHAGNVVQAISMADKLRARNVPVSMIAYNENKTIQQYCEYALNSQLAHVVMLPKFEEESKDSNIDVSCEIPQDAMITVCSSKHCTQKEITIADLLGGKVK